MIYIIQLLHAVMYFVLRQSSHEIDELFCSVRSRSAGGVDRSCHGVALPVPARRRGAAAALAGDTVGPLGAADGG